MADIKTAAAKILKHEGGYTNHPADHGGPTNKGITLATFRQYFGSYKTAADLQAITYDQWLYIFKRGYWDPIKGTQINEQRTADLLADFAFNSGVTTAAKKLQRIVGTTPDGIVGPKTIAAANTYGPALFNKLKAARLAYVEAIARANPSQRVFLKGWKNRINSFVLLLILLCVCSCKAKQVVTERVVHTERIDTITVTLPAESHERITPDSISILETTTAVSTALVDKQGVLHHAIYNKPQAQVQAVTTTETKEVKVPVPMERKLTWWQRTRLRTWWWLAIAVVALALYINRKRIVAFARRFI